MLAQILSGIALLHLAAGSAQMPHLGLGFYMPDTSTYRYDPNAGMSVFKKLKSSCFMKRVTSSNKAELLFFPTPERFYQYLGNDLGMSDYDIIAHNFYKTLLDVSQSISTNLRVAGAGIEISRDVYDWELHPDCIQDVQLDDTLIADFKKLEHDVAEPSLYSSWAVYEAFIKKYGTHYIRAAGYGNKILNFVFSKKSSGYTEVQLGASTCAKLRDANLTFCNQYTSTDYTNAERLLTAEFFEVRGGSEAARTRLTVGQPTSQEIYDFVNSGTDNQENIRIKLEPLTALLKRRFVGTRDFVKVLNMQQYYEGFVSQGCGKRHVNGVLTKRFVLAGVQQSVPEYKCELAQTGCQQDSDCHLTASSFWTHCYCYGQTCLTSSIVDSILFGSYLSRVAQTSQAGSTYEGPNMSCHYEFGPSCYCDKAAVGRWVTVWPGPGSDLSHDLQMYRQMNRRFTPVDSNNGVKGGKVSGVSLVLPIVFLPIARQIFV